MKSDIKSPLRRVELQISTIYGPVKSRRLGRSLGINLSPNGEKICSLDCLYCQYGFKSPVEVGSNLPDDTFPAASLVLHLLEDVLKREGEGVDTITFSGNGEPTLHPDFHGLVEGVVWIRDHRLPSARIALLSNGTTLNNGEVRSALTLIDDPVLKLDAGSEGLWRKINRPAGDVRFEGIIEAMEEVEDFIVQGLFFAGNGAGITGNISGEGIEDWLAAVNRIRPRFVQIYTLDRIPAMTGIERAPGDVLSAILASVERLGIRGQVF